MPRIEGGLKRASVDVAVVAGWWSRWPDAAVGIRTGAESGLVVLDVDPEHGGAETLAALERQHGPLPGPHVRTGGGGRHYFFAHPGGEVRNSAGRLGPGLDVRGDGGYVVAPPSPHESGRAYETLRSLDEREPAPSWLLAAPNGNRPVVAGGAPIPAGRRNSELAALGGALRRRGGTEAEILAAIRAANERCQPPLNDAEVASVAASVARYEPATGATGGHVGLRRLAEIEMRSIEWLERPLWQRSAFQLLAGPKGAGKGTYLASLAARVSARGRVLFVSSEDSASIDLKPRLVAAGADMGNCFLVDGTVRLPEEIDRLRELAEDAGGVELLVIDPIANHIGDPQRERRRRGAPRDRATQRTRRRPRLPARRRPPSRQGPQPRGAGEHPRLDRVGRRATGRRDDRGRQRRPGASGTSRSWPATAPPTVPAQVFRIDAVAVAGLAEPITLAVDLGQSAKSVDDLLAGAHKETKTTLARELILNILEGEGEQESDAIDARVARETGLAAGSVRNLRTALKNEGLREERAREGRDGDDPALDRLPVGGATAVKDRPAAMPRSRVHITSDVNWLRPDPLHTLLRELDYSSQMRT